MEGPKLFIQGAEGYDIASYFEKKLNVESKPLEEGHNVVNFSLEIARALGCNPLILVGMDLGTPQERFYSPGVSDGEKIQDKEAIWRKDIYGKPLKTLWKWVAESHWISDFAKQHPELKVINATVGGLGFQGVENKPLKQIAFNKSKAFRIQRLLKKAPVTPAQVKKEMKVLEKSLGHTQILLESLVKETTRLARSMQKTHHMQTSSKVTLAELDLVEEPAYGALLHQFFIVFSKVVQRELTKVRLEEKKKISWKTECSKALLNEKKYRFLLSVVKVNRQLIDLTLKGFLIP
jgi:hypothetical protein